MALAFEGVRVLDFTQVLAGPFATQQLAMLGAEVIKVEQPGVGDQTRQLMGSPDDGLGVSPAFLTCNVGKRSLTLDLKHPGAGEVVRRLVERTDVLVENFRPGSDAAPRLRLCRLSRDETRSRVLLDLGLRAIRAQVRGRGLRRRDPSRLRHDGDHRLTGVGADANRLHAGRHGLGLERRIRDQRRLVPPCHDGAKGSTSTSR